MSTNLFFKSVESERDPSELVEARLEFNDFVRRNSKEDPTLNNHDEKQT